MPILTLRVFCSVFVLRSLQYSQRKRIIKTNLPVGKKRGKGRCEADPKTVTVSDRLKEYSEETFVSSCGRLFCSSCREAVSLKKSVIEHHIVSQKHKRRKEQQKKAKMHDQSISNALKAYDKSIHPVGEKLPEAVRVRRVKVVQALPYLWQSRTVFVSCSWRTPPRLHLPLTYASSFLLFYMKKSQKSSEKLKADPLPLFLMARHTFARRW